MRKSLFKLFWQLVSFYNLQLPEASSVDIQRNPENTFSY